MKKLVEYGIHIPDEEREKRFHGRPARPTVNDLFAELDKSIREQIIEECAEYDASVESYPMIPGVDAFIKQCVESGVRIGLVTSALPGKVERMLAGLSVSNPFECMVTADRVESGKTDPECYLLVAKEMGINPVKMVVFEDSVSGVKAASDAGATVIGVNEEYLVRSLKDVGAVEVHKDFRMAGIESMKKGIRILPGGEKNGQPYMISVN